MPRTARAIVAHHCYHVINRGNNHARIFHEHADYSAFVSLMNEARARFRLPLLAACLMPNHLHLVVRPQEDDDLTRWTHWLFTTHVRRYHRKYATSGRIWQGRFKAFLIQQDHHLLTVMRYVERNALRASLVSRAEQWRWGSLYWRTLNSTAVELDSPPIALPTRWIEYVNEPQSSSEIEAIRTCVNRQRPFGSVGWVEHKARELGLGHSLANLGRPRTK
ncbi:MAG: transposase [Steroidobacteraceae bacterium]